MAAILWFILYGFIAALVIIVLIRLIKFLGVATKEKKLTRMEMARLAEEVHILREELNAEKQ